MLIDTGASLSPINVAVIKEKTRINTNTRYNISGITGGNFKTLGSIEGKILINNNKCNCVFNVVEDLHSMKTEGILGADFLINSSIIDCLTNQVTIKANGMDVNIGKQYITNRGL